MVVLMGSDAMMFDIQTDASWEQLVAELEAMEGRRVNVESDSADPEECGRCSFQAELKPPEVYPGAGDEALRYDLEGAAIVIHRSEIVEAEVTAGYIGIKTATRSLTVSRYVEPGGKDGRPGHLVCP